MVKIKATSTICNVLCVYCFVIFLRRLIEVQIDAYAPIQSVIVIKYHTHPPKKCTLPLLYDTEHVKGVLIMQNAPFSSQ